MRILILGGSGFIGSHLRYDFLKQGHEVSISTRIKQDTNQQKNIIYWDASQYTSLLPHLMHTDVVINLIGTNIAQKRWTTTQKQNIIQSRILSCKYLYKALHTLQKNNESIPQIIIQASACGYYGLWDNMDTAIICTEESPNGLGFLAKVCRIWEQECIKNTLQLRHCTLRLAPVMGKSLALDHKPSKPTGFLAPMIKPFQYYMGGVLGSGKQPLPWVHIDDVIASVNFLIHNKQASGIFNICSPQTINMQEFVHVIAKVLQKPAVIHIPSFVLKASLGQMAEELILSGQKVIPKRLNELGFNFKYANVQMALEQCLSND